MRRQTAVLVLASCAALAAACAPSLDPRAPASVAVRLKFKASCGAFSATSYDTSCLRALYLQVLDESGNRIESDCEPFVPEQGPSQLGALLFADEPVLEIRRGLSTLRKIRLELRGVHGKGLPADADPCAPEQVNNPGHWLFWGKSGVKDLAELEDAGGTEVLEVFVDCRDCTFDCDGEECRGCSGIADGICPVVLPPSRCIPSDRNCARLCQTDADCFGGLLQCDPVAHRCTQPSLGGLCAPCSVNDAGVVDGCGDDGLVCVATTQGARAGFCAPDCLADDFCPAGTMCNRLGNNLFQVKPPARPDGGS